MQESPSGVTKGGAPGAGDDSDFASEFDGSTTPCEDGSGLVTLNLASEGGELGSVSDLTSRDLDDLLLLQSIPKVIALPNQDCGMPLCIFSKASILFSQKDSLGAEAIWCPLTASMYLLYFSHISN